MSDKNKSLPSNDIAADFTAETTGGLTSLHERIGGSNAILFAHPKDFTPVCTTELGCMAGLKPEFDNRNCKVIGLSVDPVAAHRDWSADIEETQGHAGQPEARRGLHPGAGGIE